jgi:hypothetical protein
MLTSLNPNHGVLVFKRRLGPDDVLFNRRNFRFEVYGCFTEQAAVLEDA